MKTKSHIIYKLKDKKTIIPGVTAISGQLEKYGLLPAAVNLTKEGFDYKKVWDNLASIGTLTHQMIVDYFTNKKTDFSDNDPNQIAQAENSFISFLEWEKRHKIEVIMAETPLVHDELLYGGTMDLYCKLDDVYTCVDFKTGKGIWDEHYYQMAALRELLRHNDHRVNQCIILNIPRTNDESFDDKVCSFEQLDRAWRIFMHLLAIYYERKENK